MSIFNKQELRYIGYAGLFAFIWFVLALNFLVKTFDGESVIFQFFVFNLGLYAFLFIFLKSITTSTRVNLQGSFGLLSLFVAMDIFLPEYHLNTAGELIKGSLMGVSTSDYFFGYVIQGLGVSGFLLYLAVYIATPLVLLFISSRLLPNFVKNI